MYIFEFFLLKNTNYHYEEFKMIIIIIIILSIIYSLYPNAHAEIDTSFTSYMRIIYLSQDKFHGTNLSGDQMN